MKMRKIAAMGLSAVMAASMVPALPVMADDAAGKVYYLNFKPEQDEAWQNLAAKYTEETGVPVTVVTAASGQYETTLQSEMAKSDAPTLFQVNGPVGLKNWKDYCYDLSGSDIYSQLTSDAYTVKDGDAVDGIAYVIESYGLIVNKTLLEKAGYTVDDIKSFDDLKKVADDIQARKDELGVKGAFTSAGMDGSSDWRFKTHLANLPIYYEYQADGIDDTDAIKGTYLDNYKNVFDLYITDSTCDGAELSAKTADDSRNEFINGDAVFYQNGSWEYGELSKTYSDDELAMIPIYFGVDDDALMKQMKQDIKMKDITFLRIHFDALCKKYRGQSNFSHIYIKFVFSNLLKDFYDNIPGADEAEFGREIDRLYKSEDFSCIMDIVNNYIGLLEKSFGKEPATSHREIETVKNYIHSHYGEEIGAQQLADMVYLAPSYLSSLFKKETGQNLSKYIKQYRMEKAKELLTGTNMKIVNISEQVGYPNVSYFVQSFREYFGVSPQKFRDQGELS